MCELWAGFLGELLVGFMGELPAGFSSKFATSIFLVIRIYFRKVAFLGKFIFLERFHFRKFPF